MLCKNSRSLEQLQVHTSWSGPLPFVVNLENPILYALLEEACLSYDTQRTKRAHMQFADNVGPDQHAHLCSLIWAFSVS